MYRYNQLRRNVLRRRQGQQSSWFSVSSRKIQSVRPAIDGYSAEQWLTKLNIRLNELENNYD